MTHPPIPIGQTARRIPEFCEDCGEPLDENGRCEGYDYDIDDYVAALTEDVPVREGLL